MAYSESNIVSGRVISVILDQNHAKFQELGEWDSIGVIFYKTRRRDYHGEYQDESSIDEQELDIDDIAYPLYPNLCNIPLVNEMVPLIEVRGREKQKTTYYLPPIKIWNHPHHNALPSLATILNVQDDNNTLDDGFPTREIIYDKDNNEQINLGRYFDENLSTRPLLPYEGDVLLEGRFGNSIRFGSTNSSSFIVTPNPWSNGEVKVGDPITIIRNGQSVSEEEKGYKHTLENINEDNSSIYMTSNQVLNELEVAGVKTSDPKVIGWPSFGALEEREVQIQPSITVEAPLEEEALDNKTEEEIFEEAAGEELLTNTPSSTEEPTPEDDLIIFSKLPDYESQGRRQKIEQFVNNLFGEHCVLQLTPGQERPVFFSEANNSTGTTYITLKEGTGYAGTKKIEKQKLIEMLSYYNVKISHKLAPWAHLGSKERMFRIAKGVFRAHYGPINNVLHFPSVEAIKEACSTALALGEITEEELDIRARVYCLNDCWAELAHSADIEEQGVTIFGYLKDDIPVVKNLFDGYHRPKGQTERLGQLYHQAPENIEGTELENFYADINDVEQLNSYKMTVTCGGFPENLSPSYVKYELEFPKGTSRKKMERKIARHVEKSILEDYDLLLSLEYVDLGIITENKYDNDSHYEGRTHNIVEPRLAQNWLEEGYNAEEVCAQQNFIEVITSTKETAELAYKSAVERDGETESSLPPYKYHNEATGDYIWRSLEFDPIPSDPPPPEDEIT